MTFWIALQKPPRPSHLPATAWPSVLQAFRISLIIALIQVILIQNNHSQQAHAAVDSTLHNTSNSDASTHAADLKLTPAYTIHYWLDVMQQTEPDAAPETLLQQLKEVQFLSTDTPKLSFGWASYPIWLKLTFKNPTSKTVEFSQHFNYWQPSSTQLFQLNKTSQHSQLIPLKNTTTFLAQPFTAELAPKSEALFYLRLESHHPIHFYITEQTALNTAQPSLSWLWVWMSITAIGCLLLFWSMRKLLPSVKHNTLVQQRIAFSGYCLLMVTLATPMSDTPQHLTERISTDIWIALSLVLLYVTSYRHLHQQVNNDIIQSSRSKWALQTLIVSAFVISLMHQKPGLSLLLAGIPCFLLFWVIHINFDYFKKRRQNTGPKQHLAKNKLALLNPIDQYLSVIIFSLLSLFQFLLYWRGGPSFIQQASLFQAIHALSVVTLGLWQLIFFKQLHQQHQSASHLGQLESIEKSNKSTNTPSNPPLFTHTGVDSRNSTANVDYLAAISGPNTQNDTNTPNKKQTALYEKAPFNLRTLGHDILKKISIEAKDAKTQMLYSIKPTTVTQLKGPNRAIEVLLIELAKHSLKRSAGIDNVLKMRLETDEFMENNIQLICSLEDTLPSNADFNTTLNQYFINTQAESSKNSNHHQTHHPEIFKLRDILLRLGGQLTVSSSIPAGTHYQLMLPVSKDSSEETDHRAIFSVLRNKLTLLMTYQGDYGTIMSEQANSLDIPLSLALSSRQALQNLEHTENTRSTFDLILLDYTEPTSLVTNLLEDIKKIQCYQNTPIVILVPEHIQEPHIPDDALSWPVTLYDKPASFAQLGTLMMQCIQAIPNKSLPFRPSSRAQSVSATPRKHKKIQLMR